MCVSKRASLAVKPNKQPWNSYDSSSLLNRTQSSFRVSFRRLVTACITLLYDECVPVTKAAPMQTVLSARGGGGEKRKKETTKCAVKTSVKTEQTLKGCHSFSIYRIQAPGWERERERAMQEREALQKNGNILQGGPSHLSCQVALKYVIVRVFS